MSADSGALAERLEAIKAESGDQVALDDLAEIVVSIMHSIEGDLSAADLRLHRDLKELHGFIREAREEIAAIQPEKINAHHIPKATDELDAVVQATEEATGIFLDAAEEIEQIVAVSEPAVAERLSGIATKIYEASNFQDITGQRIGKVVGTLRDIEQRVERMTRLASGAPGGAVPEERADDQHKAADLLNGPALPAEANSQDDVDALLASFD